MEGAADAPPQQPRRGNDLRLDESVGAVQLDTYGLRHQTCRCRGGEGEGWERERRAVDTELIRA